MTKTYLRKIFLILIPLVLSACVSTAVETVRIANDNKKRSENIDAAKRGDKIAQYKVGESYCCSTADSGPAYDTKLSIQWLCSSARQGYAPAMYILGKIYTGDVVDGVRLLRRAAMGLSDAAGNSTVSMPVGYAWLRLAQKYGSEDAAIRLQNVKSDMTGSDIRTGESLAARGLSIPCQMQEVLNN